MLFYTRCHYVAEGKITVDDTDTNSMKLEEQLLFEIGPEAFICNSMTATAISVLFVSFFSVFLEGEPKQHIE